MGATMGSAPQLTVRVESNNGVARIALSGELDMASAPILQEQLTRSEQDDVKEIMVDLRDLSFLDSTGLHAFVRAKERAEANGRRFILVGTRASSRRMFELTQTQFLLDDEEAVNVMGRFTESADDRARQLGIGAVASPARPLSQPDGELLLDA